MSYSRGQQPSPKRATAAELGIVHRLHRVGETSPHLSDQNDVYAALDLLVELIEDRDRWRNRNEHWDHYQAEGSAE